MRTINDFKKTEAFLVDKLLSAQLDNFCVFSTVLDLNLLIETDGGLENRCVSITGDVCVSDGVNVHHEFPEIVRSVYNLIGERVTSMRIDQDGTLTLCFGDKALTVKLDYESSEVIWSVTPESSDLYEEHSWSVVLTDESELVMSQAS